MSERRYWLVGGVVAISGFHLTRAMFGAGAGYGFWVGLVAEMLFVLWVERSEAKRAESIGPPRLVNCEHCLCPSFYFVGAERRCARCHETVGGTVG